MGEGIAAAEQFSLVLDLVRDDPQHDRRNAALARLQDEQTVDAFLRFLDRHQLTGAAMAELRRGDSLGLLPKELQSVLRAKLIEDWSRSAALFNPMRELHDRFSERAIEHLFLKGPLFAIRCYDDEALRRTSDIDFLVREKDLARAEAQLKELGFEHISTPIPGRSITMRFTHHFELFRGPTVVELHWTLSRQCGLRLSEERLWAEPEECEFRGTRFPAPSLETTLLALVLGLATDLALGGARLRSLFDLRQILRTLPSGYDWDEFFERRRREGILDLTLALLEMSVETLDAREELPECARSIRSRSFGSLLGEERNDRQSLRQRVVEFFDASPPAWTNKQAIFELLSPATPLCWGWWLGSLPWRLAAHRPERAQEQLSAEGARAPAEPAQRTRAPDR